MALRLRRGTDAERLLITPAEGELIYTIDTQKVYVGDGVTQGGILVSNYDFNILLSNDIDINGFNIFGNGNIDITGNMLIDGSVRLGLVDDHNIYINGTVSSNIIPTSSFNYSLGSEEEKWHFGYFSNITTSSFITDTCKVNSIINKDNTLIYDSDTDTLTVSHINVNSLQCDIRGSMYGDDSSIIIDGMNHNAFFNDVTIDGSLSFTDNITEIVGDIRVTIVDNQSNIMIDPYAQRGFFNYIETSDIVVNGKISGSLSDLLGNTIIESDSKNIFVNDVNATGRIQGELVGSLIGDDSSILIDHISQSAMFNSLTINNELTILSSIPSTSKGQSGDTIGMFACDSTYIYYCTQDYTTGTIDIWKRINWSVDTW